MVQVLNAVRSSGLGLSSAKTFIFTHKIISLIVVAVLLGGGYWAYTSYASTDGETRYVLGTVERGTLVASVSASGQVSASNQVDITSSVSGDVISVPVKAGQKVTAGTLIAQLDPGDAAYDLETARLSYDKLVNVDATDLRDAQNAVKDAEEDVADAYTNARATLTDASTDMTDTAVDLDDLRSGYLGTNTSGLGKAAREYIERASDAYWDAENAVQKLALKYRTLSSKTTQSEIDSMMSEANETSILLAQAAKYTLDAVVYLRDSDSNESVATAAYTSAMEAVTAANAIVSDVSSAKSSLTTSKRALETAQNDLEDLQNGPDELDLRSEQLSLRQKQDALADYSIRAPFDGTIATLDVQKGDMLSNNGAVATLITDQKIAELSLNEVDAAKIKVGDRATLTFDAIEDLSLTGAVAEIDSIGTVEQGVVSYTVKIGFDSQDDRIKPGMTVNAAIQTDTKQDVLIVPSSAVKTQNGVSYVQVFNPALPETGGTQGVTSDSAPQQIEVETGISDDTSIEIISGLDEGQQIVIRTISGTTNTTTTSGNTNNRGGPPGGAAIRF
ncbi:MAG: efflux RND transporter periplasmic adaptor subunit [Minisyncoccia bacterium]